MPGFADELEAEVAGAKEASLTAQAQATQAVDLAKPRSFAGELEAEIGKTAVSAALPAGAKQAARPRAEQLYKEFRGDALNRPTGIPGYEPRDAAVAEVEANPALKSAWQDVKDEEYRKSLNKNLKGLGMFATVMGGVLGLPAASRALGGVGPGAAAEVVSDVTGVPVGPSDVADLAKSAVKKGPVEALRVAERSAPKAIAHAEAGKAFIPGLKDVRGAVDRATEAAGVRFQPKLSRFAYEPGVSIADLEARRALASSGASDTAKDIVGSVYTKETAPYFKQLDELPTLLREREMALEGLPIQGGRGLSDVDAEIAAAKAGVPPEIVDSFLSRFGASTDELFDIQKRMGMLEEGARKENYARRVVVPYYEERGGIGGVKGGIGVPIPGSTKQTVGTERAIERSAARGLGFHAQEVLSAEASHDFAEKVKSTYSMNELARAHPEALPEDVALYSFGEKGGPGAILQPQRAQDYLRDSIAAEKGQALGKAALTGPDGKKYYVLPKELAQGLVEAGERMKLPGIAEGMRKINTVVKGLYLNDPLPNLQYHVTQILQDMVSGAANVPLEHGVQYVKKVGQYAKEMAEDLVATMTGKRAPRLEQRRKEGMVGARFETFMNERADEAGHVLNTKALPFQAKTTGDKAMTVLSGFKVPADFISQVREGANKLAVRDIVQQLGATPLRAGVYANMALGNYWKQSQASRYFGPFTQFLKYFSEAALRLTWRMAEDPVTGRNSMRGLWSGPLPKVALKAGIVAAFNRAFAPKAVRENLPKSTSGTFGQGLVTPFKDESGKQITIGIDGYGDILDAIIAPFAEAGKGYAGVGLKEFIRRSTSRMSAPAKLPFELLANQKFASGAPIESEASAAMGTDAQAALNKKNAMLPLSDKALYAARQLGGSVLRIPQQLSSGSGVDILRTLGIPINSVDPREKAQEDKYKYDAAKYDELANEIRGGKDQKKMAALWKWAAEHDLAGVWKQRIGKGFRAEAVRESQTPAEGREQRLRRFPQPK